MSWGEGVNSGVPEGDLETSAVSCVRLGGPIQNLTRKEEQGKWPGAAQPSGCKPGSAHTVWSDSRGQDCGAGHSPHPTGLQEAGLLSWLLPGCPSRS